MRFHAKIAVLLLVLTSSLLFASLGVASISFDPTGGGGPTFTDVTGFDWLPGNALAEGGTAASAAMLNNGAQQALSGNRIEYTPNGAASQPPIQVLYQATLVSILREGGLTAPAAAGTEITVVAGFREVIATLERNTATGKTSTEFEFLGGGSNFFEIWVDNSPNSNALEGTGYNDGKLILSATVIASGFTSNYSTPTTQPGLPNPLDSSGVDNYDGAGGNAGPVGLNQGPINTINGSGSSNITATVTGFDPAYFFGLLGTNINLTLFDTTQTTPFDNVDPSARFVTASGGAAPVAMGAGVAADLGLVNGGNIFLNNAWVSSGPDFQIEADGNNSFETTVVPEPVSAFVWLGILVVGCVSARYMRRPVR